MSNQENNSNNSRLTYPQIDSYYNKVMKITEFQKESPGSEIYQQEKDEVEKRESDFTQSIYDIKGSGLATAKKKKYIVLRLLNKEEFDKIYKDIKEKENIFKNTIKHLTESKKLPKTNDKGESESESNAIKMIKSIPDKFINQYFKKLEEMVNNIKQLDEVYELPDNELSKKKNKLYKYKELFKNSKGDKRTRHRRK